MSYHRCPRRGCLTTVPDALFACFPDWQALPRPVQRMVSSTARLPLLSESRRGAIAAAREAWDGMSQTALLETMTLGELRSIARAKGIRTVYAKGRDEIIQLLR